jgi:hypothetical protein
MAFKEIIEAVLKVKDSARFQAAMGAAAKALDDIGETAEHAALQTEILERIEKKLQKQSEELAAVMLILAHSIDDVSDQMLQMAAATEVANRAQKKSGSNAVFLGKSWAFWKDRLSLTRSEIMTTAITIGAYFSPAIIAMGSSFVSAAIGGGAVAAGGLSTLIFGLVTLGTVIAPVIGGIKKIRAAQLQYNTAVEQYGVASLQAARANAHLYAVVTQNGGLEAQRASDNIKELAKSWRELTASTRTQMLGAINKTLTTLGKLLPTLARGASGMSQGLVAGWSDALKTLSGADARKTIDAMSDIFRSSIGPGLRGGANTILVLGRTIRASAPWIKRWAASWEALTKNWRKRSSDQSRVEKFINEMVNQFRAWWGLAKSVGRALREIWRGTSQQGQKAVVNLTHLIDKFTDWLKKMREGGNIDRFYDRYYNFLHKVDTLISDITQDPIQAINKYLPQVMDAIANTLATHAPTAAGIFLQAFFEAGAWAKLLTAVYVLSKFGVFTKLGRLFSGPFGTAFVEAFMLRFGVATTASGAIGRAMTAAGTASGKLFAAGLVVGVVAGLVALAPTIDRALGNKETPKGQNVWDWWKRQVRGKDKNNPMFLGPFIDVWKDMKSWVTTPPGGASGGVIPMGGQAFVGEKGPEIAQATSSGTQIKPLSGNGLQPISDIPNLSSSMRFEFTSIVQVDKREIARAYNAQTAFDKARRGQQ